MKRILSMVLAVVLVFAMAFTFVGCASGECEVCGKDASLSTFRFEGESMKVCSDCKSGLEMLASLASAFG
jgi:hypothetical protein